MGTASAGVPLVVLDRSTAPVEDRFSTELRLLLGDDVSVLDAPPGFSDSSWLDALRPLVPAGHTVIWLDPAPTGVLRASVAVVEPGRAEVQVVEVPEEEGAEAALALAVHAVVATRYTLPAPLPPEPPAPSRRDTFGANTSSPTSGAVRGGIVVQTGWFIRPNTAVGPRLDLQLGADGLWLQPGIALQHGVFTVDTHLAVVRHPWGTFVRPGVRAGTRFGRERAIGVGLTVLPVRDVVTEDDRIRYDSGRIELGLDLLWGASRG